MSSSIQTEAPAPAPKLFGLSRWLVYAIASILLWGLWGLVSKLGVDLTSPLDNQVLSTLGLVLPVLLLLRSKNLRLGAASARGASWAFAAGLCGALGNIALFVSFSQGGKASVVVPFTGVYPLVSVVLALLLLKEKLNRVQVLGIALAFAALMLLNTG